MKAKGYPDTLRIFAMSAVVCLHCFAEALRGDTSITVWTVTNLLSSLLTAAVPLFFMLSGALLLTSENTLSLSYTLKKRLPRLLVPLLAWSALGIAYIVLRRSAAAGTADIPYMKYMLRSILSTPATSQLWFMYVLIPLYLLSPLLKRMTDNLPEKTARYALLLWFAVSSFFPTLEKILPEKLGTFFKFNQVYNPSLLGGYVGYFLLGYYLYTSEKRCRKLPLIIFIAADTLLIAAATKMRTEAVGEYSEIYKSYLGVLALFLAAAIFLLAKETEKGGRKKAVVFFSSLSYGVYLSHILIILSAQYFMHYAVITRTLYMGIYTFAILASALLLSIVMASIPGVSYVFAGLKFKEACESCNIQFLLKTISKGGKTK